MKVKDIRNILFLDIETVSTEPRYELLSDAMKLLWQKKARSISRFAEPLTEIHFADLYNDKAGIFAEFAKVVCISVAYIAVKKKKLEVIKYKTYSGHDERELLHQFSTLLAKYYHNPKQHFIAGHNVKEFDIPFICRRMLINNLALPTLLNIRSKKPWQVSYILDTMELWRFGDYKNYTSLSLLAEVLGIPSPKNDIDGSMVGKVYWQEDDLERIVTYCQKDVQTTILIFLKMYGLQMQSNTKEKKVEKEVVG